TPVIPDIAPKAMQSAQQHQEAAESDWPEDEAHRQIDDCHPLEMHALGDREGEVEEQPDEGGLDHFHDRQENPRAARREEMKEDLYCDVSAFADHDGRAEECQHHQQVPRDFLGPGEAVVQDVARKELDRKSTRLNSSHVKIS